MPTRKEQSTKPRAVVERRNPGKLDPLDLYEAVQTLQQADASQPILGNWIQCGEPRAARLAIENPLIQAPPILRLLDEAKLRPNSAAGRLLQDPYIARSVASHWLPEVRVKAATCGVIESSIIEDVVAFGATADLASVRPLSEGRERNEWPPRGWFAIGPWMHLLRVCNQVTPAEDVVASVRELLKTVSKWSRHWTAPIPGLGDKRLVDVVMTHPSIMKRGHLAEQVFLLLYREPGGARSPRVILHAETLATLLANPRTTSRVLAELYLHGLASADALRDHPRLDLNAIEHILATWEEFFSPASPEKSKDGMLGVLTWRCVDAAVLAKASDSDDEVVRRAAAAHPMLERSLLDLLRRAGATSDLAKMRAADPDAVTSAELDSLWSKGTRFWKCLVAAHPKAPLKRLRSFVDEEPIMDGSDEMSIALQIAGNRAVPDDLIRALRESNINGNEELERLIDARIGRDPTKKWAVLNGRGELLAVVDSPEAADMMVKKRSGGQPVPSKRTTKAKPKAKVKVKVKGRKRR